MRIHPPLATTLPAPPCGPFASALPLGKLFGLVLVLAITLAAGGCAVVSTQRDSATVVATSEAFSFFEGTYTNSEAMRTDYPRSVAVLPFRQLEAKAFSIAHDDDDPASVVRTGFYNHVASLPMRDLELHETDRRLHNAGMHGYDEVAEILEVEPGRIGSVLGVDAAVIGEVTHFDRVFAGIYSQVAVGCSVRLVRLSDGATLWQAQNVSRAHAGGVSLDPVGLAMSAVAAAWNLRGTEMLSQTDELFREMVSTIYVPEDIAATRPPRPRITLFSVMDPGGIRAAGQQVRFRLVGSAGAEAYADLAGFETGIPLAPVDPATKSALTTEVITQIADNYRVTERELTPEMLAGVEEQLATLEVYEGSYTVQPGEEGFDLHATGYLLNSAGGQATQLDPLHVVNVDAVAPTAPRAPSSRPLDGHVIVDWEHAIEERMGHYEVATSQTATTGFAVRETSETNSADLREVDNFRPFFVKVRAVDAAGNEGPWSETIRAVALPRPDLYELDQPGPSLSGTITRPVLLTRANSPYTVTADLLVASGAVLHVEPGVALDFAPQARLIIDRADVRVYGQPDRPVTMGPMNTDANAGATWGGMVIRNHSRADIRHVLVQHADTGLQVMDAAPRLHGLHISHSSDTALLLRHNARPQITCGHFIDNTGAGAVIVEGEGVNPRISDSVFLGNKPLAVQNYSPLLLDMRSNWWGTPDPQQGELFIGEVQARPALTAPPARCQPRRDTAPTAPASPSNRADAPNTGDAS